MSKIQFWSLADRQHVDVPKNECTVEVVKTAKGDRKRVVAKVKSPKDGKVRQLSKFVSKDFVL